MQEQNRTPGNRLLEALPEDARARLRPYLEPVTLPLGETAAAR